MKSIFARLLLNVAVLVSLFAAAGPLRADDAKATEPLKLQLPQPTLKGTPEDLPAGPNIEPISDKPRPPFLVPPGVKNVAASKTVTSSVKPFTGETSQITDGKKEAFDYDSVEMKKGTQWVQVDLGETFAIYAVVLWHDHRYVQVMHDVVVQVSDDAEFKTGVTTLFNNDVDNSSGLGVGTDREYFEMAPGKLIDGKGVKARYVRGYTKGSSLSALNCWQEIEVYALPVGSKTQAAIMPPAAATIANPPQVVLQSSEVNATAIASVESQSSESTTMRTVRSATSITYPGHVVPVQVNAAATAHATASVTTPAPSQPQVLSTSPIVASGFNRVGLSLAGLMAFLLLVVVHLLTRDSRIAPASLAIK